VKLLAQQREINVEINGRSCRVPEGLTLIQAMWHAGYEVIRGIGCLGGVCGACAVYYRVPGKHELQSGLACQLLVEEGLSFSLSPNLPVHNPRYHIEKIRDPKQELFQYFPEAALCRNCNACTEACPQHIDVRTGIWKAAFGEFQEVADLFLPCVMCGLCVPVCIADISSHKIGLYARRTQAAILDKMPDMLRNRIAEIENGAYDACWNQIESLSEAELRTCSPETLLTPRG